MKTLQVTLPEDLYLAVRARAEAEHRSASNLIRIAIYELMARLEAPTGPDIQGVNPGTIGHKNHSYLENAERAIGTPA